MEQGQCPRHFGYPFGMIALAFAAILISSCASAGATDTLRVATQPLVNLDPAFIASDSEVLVANSVYNYLVDVDAQNQVQPRLATAWQVSDDGLTWTFDLAPDVRFHDGSPFSAEDVLWTYERLRDTDGLPTQSLYQNIANIEVLDDTHVRFELTTPNPFFLFDLSDNHALILNVGTEDADVAMNGTGPYRLAEYIPGSGGRMTLEANEEYFVDGLPRTPTVELIFFDDEVAEVNALRSGQVDIITQVSTPLFKSIQDIEGIETFSVATNGFPIVRLRSDQPPGDDPRIMQAIKHAIDREEIFKLVQQGFGAIGNDHPVGPMYLESGLYASDVAPLDRDLEKAKQLLAEAGYADGLDLTLRLPEALNFPDLAVVLKEQLAEVGITLGIEVVPESVYYGGSDWMDANFGITGWGSRPYPQFYLEVMLTCEGQWNEARYCDEAFDEMVRDAGSTSDEAERMSLYRQIQETLAAEGPMVIPFFFAQHGAQRAGVLDFEMKPFPGRSDLATVRVTPTQ